MERRRLIIISEDVLCDKSLSLAEKCVYARIAGFEEYFESAEECASLLGLGLSTVRGAKQKLEKLGYIECVRNTGRGKAYRAVLDYRKGDSTASRPVTQASSKKEPSKPEFGNSDINSMFTFWQENVGTPIISREKQNRRACYNLLRNKHVGREKLERAVEFVGETKEDRFAPRISDFVDLQSKFNELCAYKTKHDAELLNSDAKTQNKAVSSGMKANYSQGGVVPFEAWRPTQGDLEREREWQEKERRQTEESAKVDSEWLEGLKQETFKKIHGSK